MFPHTNTSRKFPVKTHCISQSDNLLPEQRTENNHSNMPDGAIISTTSPHENLCLKRTHTILSSTITRIAKNQKIHRIFTLVAFHPELCDCGALGLSVTFRLFDFWTFGLWELLTFGLWGVCDFGTFRVLEFGTLRPRDFVFFFTFRLWDFGGLLDLLTFGLRDFMTFRLLDF